MADVFISYSRKDHTQVEPIARALEAEGYSVWWDAEIKPGEIWDEAIEKELRAAACVLVAWSTMSVASKPVRSEADDADERGVLVPVRIDKVRLPVKFRLIQTADLINWRGDRSVSSWQRIMLQVAALVGKSDGDAVVEAPTGVMSPQARIASPPTQSQSTSLVTISALLALASAWVVGAPGRSLVTSTTVILAALVFVLFRLAEDDLNPAMKAVVRRWMLPVGGKLEVGTVEAFNSIFEAVFGRKHFSWYCLWRSSVASLIFFFLIVIAVDYLYFGMAWMDLTLSNRRWVINVLSFALFINILGDYVSLLATRLLLRMARAQPNFLPLFVLVDLVLTGILFILVVKLCVPAIHDGREVMANIGVLSGYTNITPEILSAADANWYASILTAYLTCAWLMLAMTFSPIVRMLLWSRTAGLTFIGRVLDAERKPMVALGYTAAVIILICGSLCWGVGYALAAIYR